MTMMMIVEPGNQLHRVGEEEAKDAGEATIIARAVGSNARYTIQYIQYDTNIILVLIVICVYYRKFKATPI